MAKIITKSLCNICSEEQVWDKHNENWVVYKQWEKCKCWWEFKMCFFDKKWERLK